MEFYSCMTLPFIAIVLGLVLLVWSADRFVEGAASIAHHYGMPPLLIGMVIVGFGTSAPEIMVSILAASQGNPGIALGNAYGSNITNIALVLGVTALLAPIAVHSQVLHKELPILMGVTALAAWQLWDGEITRLDAVVLLAVFVGLIGWAIWQGLQTKADALGQDIEQELELRAMPVRRAAFWLVVGLALLVVISRILVWGAVEIALGNIIGSNLFNTLAVVGIAGTIHPLAVGPEVFNRDMMVMASLTLALFVIGYGFRGRGGINRVAGALLLTSYIGYTAYLVREVVRPPAVVGSDLAFLGNQACFLEPYELALSFRSLVFI